MTITDYALGLWPDATPQELVILDRSSLNITVQEAVVIMDEIRTETNHKRIPLNKIKAKFQIIKNRLNKKTYIDCFALNTETGKCIMIACETGTDDGARSIMAQNLTHNGHDMANYRLFTDENEYLTEKIKTDHANNPHHKKSYYKFIANRINRGTISGDVISRIAPDQTALDEALGTATAKPLEMLPSVPDIPTTMKDMNAQVKALMADEPKPVPDSIKNMDSSKFGRKE